MQFKYLYFLNFLTLINLSRSAPLSSYNKPPLTNTKGFLDGLDMFYEDSDDFITHDLVNDNYDIVYDTRQKGEENYRLHVNGVYIAVPMESTQSFGPDFFEMIESVYGGSENVNNNEEVNFVVGNHDIEKPSEEKPENIKPVEDKPLEKPVEEKPFKDPPTEETHIPVIIIEEPSKLEQKPSKLGSTVGQSVKKPSETVIIIEQSTYKEKTTKAPVFKLSPEKVPNIHTQDSENFISIQKERPSSFRRR